MSPRLLLPLGYMVTLLLLSSIPGDLPPESLVGRAFLWVTPGLQNMFHIPLYAGLTLCWLWALDRSRLTPGPRFVTAFTLTLIWAVADETYQLYVPGRYGSFTDMAMNALGASLAIFYARSRLPTATSH